MAINFDKEFERDINEKEFHIWLQNGVDRGWISAPFCYTHEGDPYMTDEEMMEWEQGGDPCCFVMKMMDN